MNRKPTAYILLLVAACALLAGCGRSVSDADRLLARIDSLADVDPDSADVLLKPTPSPSLKGREEEVALLLRIKVDDKLYRPVTHYRDTILRLISYFEQHPKVLPSVLGSTGPALPYLYAGRIFADLGDAPQALDYYQRALDAQPARQMENGKLRIENEDARRLAKQRGLLHSLIGSLQAHQDLHVDAINNIRKAFLYDLLVNDTSGIIFDLRDLAVQYKSVNKNDSSLQYYGLALDLAEKSNNIRRVNDIKSQMAFLYDRMKQYRTAKEYIKPALCQLDSDNLTATYSIASIVYNHLGEKDSANYYSRLLLQYGNREGRSLAHKQLADKAYEDGNLVVAYHHLMSYNILEDSIRRVKTDATVARMNALYKYQLQKQKVTSLEVENAEMRFATLRLIVIISILLIISIIIISLLWRRFQKARKIILQQHLIVEKLRLNRDENLQMYEKRITELNVQIEKIYHENNLSKKALQAQIEEKEKEKDELEFLLYKQQLIKSQNTDSLRKVMETNIYKSLQSLLQETTPRFVKSDEWNQLSQVINTYFPDFEWNIRSLCEPSERQYRLCMLRKLRFSTAEIVKLVGYQEPTVYSNYKRLYEKATGQKGSSSDFEKLLEAF